MIFNQNYQFMAKISAHFIQAQPGPEKLKRQKI